MAGTVERVGTHGARSRDLDRAMNHRRTFVTGGALRGEAFFPGMCWADAGELAGAERTKWWEDMRSVTYVVFSYLTPIAWEVDGKVYRVSQRFSRTTSKHQGRLWALEMPEGYFDTF